MGFLDNLFRRSRYESVDLTNAGPLAQSLKRCRKCEALGLLIGYGSFVFSSGCSGRKHDHEWMAVSERSVITAQYNSNEASYLQSVASMLKDLPGLLQKNSQMRTVLIETLERLAQLEGEMPLEEAESHYYRATRIYHEALAHDLAAKEFEKAVELVPDNMQYRNQMAIQHFLSGNWQKAEQTWAEILQIHPDDTEAVAQYTAALTQLFNSVKDIEEKIAYSKKLVEIHPKSQRYHRDLGVSCQDARRWEEAIAHLKEAVTLATESLGSASIGDFKAEIKDRIAFCYSNIGQHAETVRYWEEALAEKNWSSSERNAILSDLQKSRAQIRG